MFGQQLKRVQSTQGDATTKLMEKFPMQQQQKQTRTTTTTQLFPTSSTCVECCTSLAPISAVNCIDCDRDRGSEMATCTNFACTATTSMPTPTPACCVGVEVQPILPCCAVGAVNKTLNNNPADEFLNLSTATSDHYVYEEPEENFISIDDDKIKELLLRIGREQQRLRFEAASEKKQEVNKSVQLCESINLADDDDDDNDELGKSMLQATSKLPNNCRLVPFAERKKLKRKQQQQKRCSPDICLIPKSPSRPKTCRIIAEIDLLDSSSEESECENGDASSTVDADADEDKHSETSLSLAAASVSCELNLVDEEKAAEIVVAVTDDEHDGNENDDGMMNFNNEHAHNDVDLDFIDVGEYGTELRWSDYADQKARNLYECLLCGKKVQSNYNLRRHMMIHTGERPFGCDLCERRFREFSDLKKHRRRHANETNYLCMICGLKAPLEHDSIRCIDCESKNLVLKPQSEAVAANKMAQTMHKQTTQTPSLPPSTVQVNTKKTETETTTATTNMKTFSNNNKHQAEKPSDVNTADKLRLLESYANNASKLTAVKSRRRAFQCPICQREFGTRHNLKRHFMIHTGEKPFSCNKCRKPFREYSTLKKHMVTHQRDRLYKCLRCPQRYRDYLEYTAHKRTHPELADDDETDKNGTLNAHDDSYDEDEDGAASPAPSLDCCECGERFTDFDAYTLHIAQHDPKVIYHFECYICDADFVQRDELEVHLRTRHAKQMATN